MGPSGLLNARKCHILAHVRHIFYERNVGRYQHVAPPPPFDLYLCFDHPNIQFVTCPGCNKSIILHWGVDYGPTWFNKERFIALISIWVTFIGCRAYTLVDFISVTNSAIIKLNLSRTLLYVAYIYIIKHTCMPC